MPRLTDDQLLALTQQLVAIESTAHNSQGLHQAFDFMVQFLQESGKNITIEKFESGDKPSFLAYKGSKRPQKFDIILNGHLDVVPGKPYQFQPFVKDGKLYGRGVYDMKAACLVLADVFCEFVDQTSLTLGLQIVTDEESGGEYGTMHQIEQGVNADFVICGECGRSTTVHEIANEAKGGLVADIELKGQSAHSAYPWRGASAAIKAADFIQKLQKRYPIPTSPTSAATVAVTSVSAKSGSHTLIADRAIVSLDIRYPASDTVFGNPHTFDALIKEIDPDANVAKIHAIFLPCYTDPANPIITALKQAAEQTEKADFLFVMRNATSDGRHFGALGSSACEFGIAGEYQHGDEEYIPIAAFKNYRRTMRLFLQNLTPPLPATPKLVQANTVVH